MIEKKKIEQLPMLPARAQGRDDHIGRIRIYKDTIVMDVYDARRIMCPDGEEKEAEIRFRWVCDKKNYYTYIFSERRWRKEGMAHAVCGRDGRYVLHMGNWITLDDESGRVAEEFLKDIGYKSRWYTEKEPIDKLCDLEEQIRSERREQAEDRRYDRIRVRIGRRTSLPKDWEAWLGNHVFRDERYIFYTTKKAGEGICSHCGEAVPLGKKAGHNAQGKCPACGSRIQYKAIGRIRQVEDKKRAVCLQKIEGGFLVRYFDVVKVSCSGGENYRACETAVDTHIGEKTWRDYHKVSALGGGEYWDDRRSMDLNGWRAEGYLYTRNVKRVLKDTPYRYAPLKELAEHEKQRAPVGDFLAAYPQMPYLEYIIKAGLYKLARECINGMARGLCGRNMKEVLGINRQRAGRLIMMDGGIRALEWLRYEESHNVKIPEDVLQWLLESSIRADRCEEIMGTAGSVVRAVNYLKKQGDSVDNILVEWRDYLRMAQNEGMDTTDDIVRFPKNLRLRHAQLVSRDEARKGQSEEQKKRYEELDRRILERLPDVMRYYWHDEAYMIVPAAKCEELKCEGRILHHCVAANDSYMRQMADGRSWILFLRKRSEPDIPYYTIEIRMEDDEILQWYSAFDRKPDKEIVEKILKRYKKSIGKRKRVRIPVPVSA